VALAECRCCGQAFISGPKNEDTCPSCVVRLNKLYPRVRNFLRNDAGTHYTAYDVSKILDIDLRDVEKFITMGLIEKNFNSGRLQETKNGGRRRKI